MMTTLSPDALDWSLRHHLRFGDTDLFPRAFEFEVASRNWAEIRKELLKRNLATHRWRSGRSMLVMKDNVSFRRATQFDPIDSLLFAALIWTVGPAIEAKRPARDRNLVLSYRFEPSTTGLLFAPGKVKRAFWTHTLQACEKFSQPWLVITDVTDFYSQIRHAYLERQLSQTIPPEIVPVVMKALRAVQGNMEMGVPVGPHAAHLLAELTLLQFDEFMVDSGYTHVRFADDIHVACESESRAREVLYAIADFMHSHLQLSLSRHKTRVLDQTTMEQYARTAVGSPGGAEKRDLRGKVDQLIQDNTSRSDDEELDFEDLDDADQEALSPVVLDQILEELLGDESQVGLRQYLRSLSHLRAPGAIRFVSDELEEMLPAMPEAIEYLTRTLPHYRGDQSEIAAQLLQALGRPIVRNSAHMQTLILALLVQIPNEVEFSDVTTVYKNVAPSAQREILLLAGKLKRSGWLQSQVSTILSGADTWLLRALVEASSCLGEADRRDLKSNVKDRLGKAWLLEDPTRHDRALIAASHFRTKTPRDGVGQEVTLTFSEPPGTARLADLAKRYFGKLDSVENLRAVFRDLKTQILLADVGIGQLEGDSGTSSIDEIVLSDGECVFERLPEVTFTTPAEVDVGSAELRKALEDVDILLVTTADVEKRAVLSKFESLSSNAAILVGSLDNITYRIGRFGRYAAAHVHTTQGADGRSGATLSVRDALSGAQFKACLVVGIAFGFDRKAQRLGDVLVAEQIQPYEHAKVQGDDEQSEPRGTLMQCGNVLSDRFRNRMDGWARRRTVSAVQLHQGTVLAGAKLVNSRAFRDRLYAKFKDLKPVGGEMEGHGAFAAAQKPGVEIILVKSICDWADGTKNDVAQQFAAETAADACHHLLSKPGVLDALKARDLGPSAARPTELPDIEKLFRTKVELDDYPF